MRKISIALIISMILVTGFLSGCNQISNVFLSDDDKLVGTWNSDKSIIDLILDVELPAVYIFFSNNTFQLQVKLIASLTFEGEWEMNDGILTMEIFDINSLTNYTYQFSDDNTRLTLTDIGSNESYLLRKQQSEV